MTVKITRVKVKLNHAAIKRIKARTKSELQTWARNVLNRRVEPVTPIDTGDLRKETDVQVTGGDTTEVWWFWKVPYAAIVESSWGGKYSPRTLGTIAPFAVPTITEVVKEEVDQPIGKAFGG